MRTRLKNTLFLGVATVLVVGAVVAAIVVLGGPGEGRARSLDEARVNHLGGLKSQIDTFFAREHRLPASLDELSKRAGFPVASRDPLTSAPYEYRATGPTTYEVCATFQRASDPSAGAWSHRAGRQCFPLAARQPGR